MQANIERNLVDLLFGLIELVRRRELPFQVRLLLFGQVRGDDVEPTVDALPVHALLDIPSLVKQRHNRLVFNRTIGLRETRRREWLLEIEFAKRETFAYACETYSRIHGLGRGLRARQTLLAQYAQGPMPADDRLDVEEYLDILREAVAARNGWKRILARCAPPQGGYSSHS
jgi:hypothetical protein